MKKVILSALVLAQALIAFSQTPQGKHIANVETGYIYYTYDGRGGLYINNSYVYVLNGLLSINGGVIMAQTNYNPTAFRSDQSTLFAPYAGVIATPLPNMGILGDLRVGAGLLHQRMRSNYANINATDPSLTDSYRKFRENQWGFITNVEMTAYKTSIIEVGANVSMLTSIYKGTYYVDAFTFGVKGIIKL